MHSQGIKIATVIDDSAIVIQWGNKLQEEKHGNSNPIQLHLKEIINRFGKLELFHILRHQNKIADRMENLGVSLAPRTLEING